MTVRYPGRERYWETLRGIELGPGKVELRQHATFIPLAPTDVVSVDDDRAITDVLALAPLYTFEVCFWMPADLPAFHTPTEEHRSMKAVAQTVQEWHRDAWVTRETNFTAYVSSTSYRWLQANVASHRYVDFTTLIRKPDTRLDYSVAVMHPDINGTREGPIA